MSEAPETAPTRGARAPNTPGRRLALIVFLLSPLAVLAVLMVLIAISIKQPKKMNEPAIGAGAGQTGMINEHMNKPKPEGEKPAPEQKPSEKPANPEAQPPK